MGMIKGITIKLITLVEDGTDDFGAPTYTESFEEIENVLVGEPTSDDITSDMDMYGKRLAFTLAIPKGDTHEFKDQIVEMDPTGREENFQRFRVYGDITSGIESMIPLSWNKKVKVERYE